ncbi:hypothetical protein [Armatimonas sp.]|uniref:hypothetical protein n=1 Tax=Armatimonas sp. TaxID=1872638 RepID=UPI00286B43D7|nr:hypothetical protein [Armatimonas sp.]
MNTPPTARLLESSHLAPTTETATESTLPLWRLPEARSDKEARLGILMRNILWLDAKGGCHAANEFFAHHPTMGLGRDVATIRRGLADLEAAGLIVREFDAFGKRTIRPLVTAVELIEAGWAALAESILGMTQWPAVIRALCRSLLKRLGKWRKELDLSRLGVRPEHQNCAGSARTIARPSPSKEREAQKTTTVPGTGSEPRPAGVVVSPAEVSEPESEAITVAVEAGLDRNAARRAVGEKPLEAVRSAVKAARVYVASHEVRSLPALLVTAIRAGWLAPAPPSSYGSDRGERPVRVVVAPAQMRTETAPRPIEADASTEAWEALSEDQRAELLAVALTDALETASEAEKALVRRRGVDSLPVVMRAKRLARKRAEALGASDAG